jgi:hypothetical protein
MAIARLHIEFRDVTPHVYIFELSLNAAFQPASQPASQPARKISQNLQFWDDDDLFDLLFRGRVIHRFEHSAGADLAFVGLVGEHAWKEKTPVATGSPVGMPVGESRSALPSDPEGSHRPSIINFCHNFAVCGV